MSEEEEDREHEYPEGSLGWKINQKLAAVDAKPLKYGAIFLIISALLSIPVIIEIALFWSSKTSALASGSIYANSPFLDWLQSVFGMSYETAQYYIVVYIVTLLMFAGVFLYYGMRLIFSRPTTNERREVI